MSVYDPLRDFLNSTPNNYWRASFEEIENVLGRPLPASAYRYQAWWANEEDGQHSHAYSWLKAGWKTEGLDLAGRQITFVREL